MGRCYRVRSWTGGVGGGREPSRESGGTARTKDEQKGEDEDLCQQKDTKTPFCDDLLRQHTHRVSGSNSAWRQAEPQKGDLRRWSGQRCDGAGQEPPWMDATINTCADRPVGKAPGESAEREGRPSRDRQQT